MYDIFYNRIKDEYELAFPTIEGADVELAFPTVRVSKGRLDFPNCKL